MIRTRDEIRAACEANAAELRKVVGLAAWYDRADRVLTPAEGEQVRRLWDTMPGYTCWNDAFLRWMADGCPVVTVGPPTAAEPNPHPTCWLS